MLGYGAGAAAFLGAFEYTGGSLFGWQRENEADKFERLERIRKGYRNPGEETVDRLGEGRGGLKAPRPKQPFTDCFAGIYGAGYEERRRRRIREAYGIEVPVSPAPAS